MQIVSTKIRNSAATIVLAAAFSGAGGAAQAECCTDPLKAQPKDVTYLPFGNAGIKIPTYNQRVNNDGSIVFDIHRKDFSAFKYLMSKTMGLYDKGQEPKQNHACPYINLPDQYFTKQYLDDGVIRVTLRINRPVLEIVERHGCVITDTPAP